MEVFNFRDLGLLPVHGYFGCHCSDQMFFRFDSSSSFIFSCSCYFSGKGTFNVKLHLQQQHGWLYYDIASFSRDVSYMSILIGTCWSPCSHENNLNSIIISLYMHKTQTQRHLVDYIPCVPTVSPWVPSGQSGCTLRISHETSIYSTHSPWNHWKIQWKH